MKNWMMKLYTALQVKKATKGQSLAEYALILALIAVVCIPMLSQLGGAIGGTLTTIAGQL